MTKEHLIGFVFGMVVQAFLCGLYIRLLTNQ